MYPSNDNFADRLFLYGNELSTTGTNIGATGEYGEPDQIGEINSVWWSWTAPSTGSYIIDTKNSNFDTYLSIFTGSTLNYLNFIAADDEGGGNNTSLVRLDAIAGTTYQIAVDGGYGFIEDDYGVWQPGVFPATGEIQLNIAKILPPANNNFVTPIILTGNTVSSYGTNVASTGESGETPQSGTINSSWWSWTAPTTGSYVINTLGSNFDTYLSIFTGNTVNGLNLIASDNDSGGSGSSLVSLNATAGTTYNIAVDGYNSATGRISLHITPVGTPPTVNATQVLDNTFDGDGILNTDFIYYNYSNIIQSDGKILIAGGNNSGFALARYNTDGSIDNTFDGDGKVTSDFISNTGKKFIVESNGKILVAGDSTTTSQVGILRYNVDGSLDNSFNTSASNGVDLKFQNDGKILVLNNLRSGGYGHEMTLRRFNADGSPDNSFGYSGETTTQHFFSYEPVFANALAVQSDGKILAAGSKDNDGYSYDSVYFAYNGFVVARFNNYNNSSGSSHINLDDSFGNYIHGGTSTIIFPNFTIEQNDSINIEVQSDGKILVVGSLYNGSDNDIGLARLHADGSLDYSFGRSGQITTNFGDNEYVTDIKVQSDGKILVLCQSELVRYNIDGSLDKSFGIDGKYSLDELFSAAQNLTLQPDGKILITGKDYSYGGVRTIRLKENISTTGPDMLIGTAGADIINGLAGNDTISGLGGNDSLLGSDGDDSINGGLGDDSMYGGNGNDIYLTNSTNDKVIESLNAGTDRIYTTATYTLPVNVEHLYLQGTTAINGTGNAQNNNITGNTANNSIDGGIGDDTMSGGTGDDTYYTNSANDKVIEDLNAGTDRIYTTVTYTLPDNVEHLYLTGTTAINGTGNTLNNIINGNTAGNSINGGAGNDTMTGGAGNDTYYTNSANDKVIEALNAGTDRIYTTATYTLPDNVENLYLQGTTAINGIGNTLNNIITGNTAGNRINGGAGNDTMTGGAGNDTYYTNSANDKVIEGLNAGIDRIYTTATYTLPANVENLYLQGTRTINGTGNSLANRIVGNTAANRINGGGGNDTLIGNAGNDYLTGGAGIDNLTGGGGNDTLIGNAGNDRMMGSTGADRFLYNTNRAFATSAIGVDTITDFTRSQSDKIVLSKTTFNRISSTAGNGFNVASEFASLTSNFATSSADIVYDRGTGKLYYNQNGTAAGYGTGGHFITLANKPALSASDFIIQA